MGIKAIFERENWLVPFHFWSVLFFVWGCMIGSFLNVCIHRMPRGLSVVSPPSHCPACGHSIPWYLNIPLVTWVVLRGKCAHCGAAISSRYFLVELLTGLGFLGTWLAYGAQSVPLALIYCLVLAGLIAATFIDLEHFIIPDEITLGGIAAGFLCSFAVPVLQGEQHAFGALKKSALGIVVGGGVLYLIVRLGKFLFGRHKIELAPDSKIVFTEDGLVLPEEEIPYEDIFYRKSDTIVLEAKRLELIDRCYQSVRVRLNPEKLVIGEESYDPERVPHMEIVTDRLVLPREAMGLGDVKFMAAIGAFLGWQATMFSLLLSSIIGAIAGVGFIVLRKREWSSRIPYGPYIAAAAVLWMFGGDRLVDWWFRGAFWMGPM
jgi:leader peptidase (prepilin peptidase) / N-methyltransferase